MTGPLLKGFSDTVADSGGAFRAILRAMSRPGSVEPLPVPDEQPSGMSPAAAAVLLAMADHSTPIWLEDGPHNTDIAEYVRFHCGAGLTPDPDKAVFAFLGTTASYFDGSVFSPGTPDYPDRSTTVIIDVDGFNGEEVTLSGPGIDGARQLAVFGTPDAFWPGMIENSRRFPLGIDIILAAGDAVAAIPRSTQIEVT